HYDYCSFGGKVVENYLTRNQIKTNEFFEVEVLSAHNNADLLIQQALKYKPNAVVIGNEQLYTQVFEALNPYDIKVFTGEKSLEDIVEF
ncbi:MAG: hypothetical protein RR328_01565, partial [Bacteroidales bacterium]